MMIASTAAPANNHYGIGHTGTLVRLADGAWVTLRDAEPERDVRGLHDMFFTLSDATRYLYFCAGVPRNETWAGRFAQLAVADGVATYALVVEVAGTVVGMACFNREAERGRAEVAILLADAWQSRGLGGEVVARLRQEAAARAVSGFTATVLGENRRAMRLLRRAFPQMDARWSSGQFEVDMPFAPEPASEGPERDE